MKPSINLTSELSLCDVIYIRIRGISVKFSFYHKKSLTPKTFSVR
ncbi:Uncharacterized protein dnm_009740 [Desulfonema magnum]|uniref:Uncharacterized protein n=1 Tax=Desulfonema magnum TaxID=45655 RepID=A0A975BH66_9BACT|nr:Uncharacterized protein dnm_009740 [Desulfonema magnum]